MMRRFREFPTIGGRRGGGIPADCVEVQYLESTGTQYIDTGVLGTELFGIDITITDIATASYNAFVCNKTSNDFVVGSNNGNTAKSYVRIRGALTWANAIGTTKHFVIKDGIISGNDTQLGTYTATNSLAAAANNVSLFAQMNGGIPSKCRISSCKLYGAGSAMFLDLVPVRRVESGVSVGYMCDRLTGALYGNAGTGAFVIGPDAGEPVWTFTDGYSLTSTGGLSANQYYSVLDQYVNAESGHSITIYWGEQRAYGNTNCLLEYDSAKNIVDYWSYNQSSGMRTITLSSRTGFVRASFKTSEIANCYIKDNTTGEYLFKGSNVN